MTDRVIAMLAEYTEMEQGNISRDTTLVSDLGLSSLDIINIAVLFEEEFGIEIPDRKASEFATVGDVADYLREHV